MKKKIKLEDLNKQDLFDKYLSSENNTKSFRNLMWGFCFTGMILGTITNATLIYLLAIIGINTCGITAGIFANMRNKIYDEISRRGFTEELKNFMNQQSEQEWQLKEPQIYQVYKRDNHKIESPFPEFEETRNVKSNNEDEIQR